MLPIDGLDGTAGVFTDPNGITYSYTQTYTGLGGEVADPNTGSGLGSPGLVNYDRFHDAEGAGNTGTTTYTFTGAGPGPVGLEFKWALMNLVEEITFIVNGVTVDLNQAIIDGDVTYIDGNGSITAAGIIKGETGGQIFDPGTIIFNIPVSTLTVSYSSTTDLTGDKMWFSLGVVCFTVGSMILTDKGEIPIETLNVGDMVQTVDDGLMPVRWIGRKKLTKAALVVNPNLRPILFRANSLGLGAPSRDMMVSPQHRMLIGGWAMEMLYEENEALMPAKALTNDFSIMINHTAEEVEYVHILFDSHQLVTVDGCVSESFFPYETSLNTVEEAAREEIFTLFPELRDNLPSYGRAVRLSLKPYEMKALMAWEMRG